jgi:hypothetical protein
MFSIVCLQPSNQRTISSGFLLVSDFKFALEMSRCACSVASEKSGRVARKAARPMMEDMSAVVIEVVN